MAQNTDHDEAFNRETWRGEEWLGTESFQAPRRGVTGQAIDLARNLLDEVSLRELVEMAGQVRQDLF